MKLDKAMRKSAAKKLRSGAVGSVAAYGADATPLSTKACAGLATSYFKGNQPIRPRHVPGPCLCSARHFQRSPRTFRDACLALRDGMVVSISPTVKPDRDVMTRCELASCFATEVDAYRNGV